MRRDGAEQHLRQKTFHVLIYLIENRQRVVSKDEIFESVWQGAAVTDNALEQCLAQIRRALGDDSRHPRFIKTISRAGYRFISPVEEVVPDLIEPPPKVGARARQELPGDTTSSPAPANNATQSRSIARRNVVILGAVVLIAASVTGLLIIRNRSSASSARTVTLAGAGKQSVAVMFFDNQSVFKSVDAPVQRLLSQRLFEFVDRLFCLPDLQSKQAPAVKEHSLRP